ncbi:MAG TPA: NAD-dependent epimerase/dehydratase family protein [Lapillicoccus sp.]|nr:NAD-dependent epimerase/dehydratase family protein [Lapillicoccus sp.]
MPTTVLITGGAGFIGCALGERLLDRFDRVVALDSLHPQVHPTTERPAALPRGVELVVGDVTDPAVWDRLLVDCRPDAVVHLAAETGTAQSLTEATRHASVNVVGTTTMLDAFTRHEVRPERIVLASSRAVYGEGAWQDAAGHVVLPGQRSHAMLVAGTWDFPGLTPLPAAAARVEPRPSSVYAATKLAQEHVLRAWGLAIGVPTVVLRLQNAYGAGQSLANPYTGILPLFARLAAAGEAIPVYEDGAIVRDFVHVHDVASALTTALTEVDADDAMVVDIGSGVPVTILDVAGRIAERYGAPAPVVTGRFRDGDVRYACADPTLARQVLGWEPQVGLDEGLEELGGWLDQLRERR